MVRRENNINLYSDNLRVRNHLEYLGVGGIYHKVRGCKVVGGIKLAPNGI
jgi:hypothetical protein